MIRIAEQEFPAGIAFAWTVALVKAVIDVSSVEAFAAQTWTHGGVFVSGSAHAERSVIDTLDEAMDEFIAGYLRVNESACPGA